jgi:hypothetical protein
MSKTKMPSIKPIEKYTGMHQRGHQMHRFPGFHEDGSDNGETPPPGPTAGQNIGYPDKAMHNPLLRRLTVLDHPCWRLGLQTSIHLNA